MQSGLGSASPDRGGCQGLYVENGVGNESSRKFTRHSADGGERGRDNRIDGETGDEEGMRHAINSDEFEEDARPDREGVVWGGVPQWLLDRVTRDPG